MVGVALVTPDDFRRGCGPDGSRSADLLATDAPGQQIPVALETRRGLLVSCLRATRRGVYAINPLAVARSKNDHADAMTLASILRVDAAHQRPLPDDSELVQSIVVLARAQHAAAWSRQQLANRLSSLLREYSPAALKAFQAKGVRLASPEARTILNAAPTPPATAKLIKAQLRAALRRAGRQRGVDDRATALQELLREEQLRQLPMVEAAFGKQVQALLLRSTPACRAADEFVGHSPVLTRCVMRGERRLGS